MKLTETQKNFVLPFLMLVALLVGVTVGKVSANYQWQSVATTADYVGKGFLNLLMMIIAPLIFFSISFGVANIGSGKSFGRISGKTFGLIVLTTLISIIIGLLFVNIIKPGIGTGINLASVSSDPTVTSLLDKQRSLGDIVLNMIPQSVFQALATNNMLQIILFAILFGFYLLKIDEERRNKLVSTLGTCFDLMIKMTTGIVALAPIGILGIVINQVYNNPDLGALFSSLGLFIVTVASGLLIQAFIVLPLLAKFMGKVKPFKLMRLMSTPLIAAYSTASSNAALPLSMEAMENRVGVSKKITGFCLPLGATVNMNGTALFECVAAIFIAQLAGYDLSVYQQIVIVVTSLLAAVGSAGIPMSGLVMLSMILTTVGLPLDGIGLILTVNFILETLRTAVNVWGNSVITAMVAKSEGEKLNV